MKQRQFKRKSMHHPSRGNAGPRCKMFAAGCITCAHWHFYDVFGKFPPYFTDAYRYSNALERAFGDEANDTPWPDARKLRVPMPTPTTEEGNTE